MAYENNDDLAKDCMVSAVQFKQNGLRAWFSPEGIIPNAENQKAVDKLRAEINDIREHYKFHFDTKMSVEFIPLELPDFGNYAS